MPGHQMPMGHQVPMMPMVPNYQHQARPQVRSHRVYVDDEDVGFVIGGGGSTVKRIKSQTGALIKHFKNDPEDTEHDTGYFNLRGNDHQIHCAKISIQELVIESKRRRIDRCSSRFRVPPEDTDAPHSDYTYAPDRLITLLILLSIAPLPLPPQIPINLV